MERASDWESAGVRPAQQERSRALRDRLIAECLRLSRERPFDDVGIVDLCAAAECSTGAFYARFPDKLTLFKAAMIAAAAESGPALELIVRERPRDDILSALIDAQVDRFRRYEMFYRSAFKVSLDDGAAWEPFRRNATALATCFLQRLESDPYPGGMPNERRVRFAFQLLYSMLNNTIMNRPGPVFLEDPSFRPLMLLAMRQTMGLPED